MAASRGRNVWKRMVDRLLQIAKYQTLRSYSRYYNEIRTHRSLDKYASLRRLVRDVSTIGSCAILGGSITSTSGFWFSVHTGVRIKLINKFDFLNKSLGLADLSFRYTQGFISGLSPLW